MIIDTKYIFIIIFLIFLKICFMKGDITSNAIKAKLVTTPEDKKTGLMFREYLNYDEGMLFKFDNGFNSVWMKNTYIPLDVLFLDTKYKVIGYVEDTVPLSLDNVSIDKSSDYILEVNSGWVRDNNIKIGNIIDIELVNELS
tara:strand:+ start:210 stop:635 length:426 start_codon:yes stop_codon:yes gene_type:complete